MTGFRTFEFDLPDALLQQLIFALDELSPAPLAVENVESIPEAQGVYQLLLNGVLVYIGKTDSEAGLRKRLTRYAAKVLNRPNLYPGSVTFKAIRIYVFTAIDLETALIRHYKNIGLPPLWNGSGFGSNDPGRERETTNIRPEGFDSQFPISIDIEDSYLVKGAYNVASALSMLKATLAYTLRYQSERPRSRSPHPDLMGSEFNVDEEKQTVRSILVSMLSKLPASWQATAFSGHVILYNERRDYAYGESIRASGSG